MLSQEACRRWLRILAGAAVVFLVAALVRWTGLDQEATHDELYHLLAGRSWLREGTLAIAGGEYARSATYSRIVAFFLGTFGETLRAARLPGLLAGSLLAASLFVLLRAAGESAAAWIAGGLAALDPTLVEVSQMVRFYALQNLVFFLGAAAVLVATRPGHRGRVRVLLALAGVILLWSATRLQVISLIGIGGLALAVVLLGARRWGGGWLASPESRRRLAWAALGIVAAAVVVALLGRDRLAGMLAGATTPDIWGVRRAGVIDYYYAVLYDDYAPLLALSPLLLVLAAVRRVRPVLWAVAIFLVGFVVHSLVAWKAPRYISYLLPFFFLIVGLGAVEGLRRLRSALHRMLPAILPVRAGSASPAGRLAVLGTLAVIALSVAGANRSFLQTARLMTRDHAYSFPFQGSGTRPMSWEGAARELRPVADTVSTVLSTDAIKALHYVGRLDYSLHLPAIYRAGEWAPEFTVDPRIGRPVISEPASVARVMQCHPSGLILVEAMSLGNPRAVRPRTADFLRSLERVPLPQKTGIMAFRWHTPPDRLREDCRLTAQPASGAGASDR